jgi:hypothetical protein
MKIENIRELQDLLDGARRSGTSELDKLRRELHEQREILVSKDEVITLLK